MGLGIRKVLFMYSRLAVLRIHAFNNPIRLFDSGSVQNVMPTLPTSNQKRKIIPKNVAAGEMSAFRGSEQDTGGQQRKPRIC
ncbi:MAG: hypothetical protein V1754_15230 [Pseudomonadota bacterium]